MRTKNNLASGFLRKCLIQTLSVKTERKSLRDLSTFPLTGKLPTFSSRFPPERRASNDGHLEPTPAFPSHFRALSLKKRRTPSNGAISL